MKKRTTLIIDKDVWLEIKKISNEKEISFSCLVNNILKDFIKNNKID